MGACEGVDQQEAQGEEREQDADPGAAANARAVGAATPVPIAPVARSVPTRSDTTRHSDALATLQLGEPADLVAMLPDVLAGIGALGLEIGGRGPEDLGE